MNRNCGAGMLVLNVGRFADSGMGNVPKLPMAFVAGESRNAPQVCGITR
jgi:hypothetical protein